MKNLWGEVLEETAPGVDEVDLSWMIPFWESFTDCVVELNAQHDFVYIRRKAHSSFTITDIASKSFFDIVAEKDTEFVATHLNQLKTTAVPYLRFQFLSKLGRYYRWTLAPFYEEGEYSGCRGVAVDVTEQTIKEITLNWQRAVIEEGRDFVRIFDMEGRSLYANPGVYEMTGYDPQTEVPSSKEIYTAEHYRAVNEEGLQVVAEQGFWIGRGELVRLDKTLIPIEHTMFSIKDEQGDIILVATVIRDITVFLEHEKTLEEARRAAEAANAAKSEFLSRMSHEIRTPMNAVIGMINIGISTDDVERKNYCFARANSAANHLLGLINDILDMSKIEADKFELSNSVFDLETALTNIVNMAHVLAEEKELEFVVNRGHDLPALIVSDEMRLTQVITNLLTNAIKFTPKKGAVTLSIESIEHTDDHIVLRIEVADTGIGISKEQQKQLFTSFNQADASISQKYGGTGLGLAISKRIVEFMGGKIWIESELNEGSKFIFTVVTQTAAVESQPNLLASSSLGSSSKAGESVVGLQKWPEAGESATAADSKKGALRRQYDFSSYRVLIVEDIDINREIMLAILEETGILIEHAENGKVAVSMFSANPRRYNLILMDINMPEMDGYEATQKIRALNVAEARSIPIIAMTANVFKEDIKKCLAAGMNDHTGKPIDASELLEKLRSYLITDGGLSVPAQTKETGA